MKKAFLVFGAESSGNRLMKQILIDSGCYGDTDKHFERIPKSKKLLVDGFSVPSNGHWLSITDKYVKLEGAGFKCFTIVMVRDWHATANSQVRQGRVEHWWQAYSNIVKAYPCIFRNIETPYTVVSFDNLIIHKNLEIISKQINFKLTYKGQIKNENQKYY